MKKFLSLVMALALTLSLVTISAGATDFTDDSSITYGEAVDVISAIGVVDGYTNGSFNPTATLTRGAAAKIICNLILGPTADSLSADAAPFKDVAANHVFAGYIAYCANQGIINGYADGTFRPAGTVTGYQFMKMLLGALGYDGSVEGFTGSNWTVNVAKLAVSIGLDDGNDSFVGTAAMTREEACLYAYNTLKATMVEYDSTGTSIVVGDTTITSGASKASDVANNATTETIKNDNLMQFAEKYFKDLKLASSATDAFERPANTWTYKSTEVGTYAKTPDLTYTAKVKTGTIYSDLGLTKAIAKADATVYVDGAASTAYDIVKGGTDKFGGNGALTEVYYDDDDNTVIITVVNTYVGDVTAVYGATSTKDAYVTVAPRGTGNGGNFDTTGFSVDDVVLFTYSNKTGEKCVESVKEAQTNSGTVSAYTTDTDVTVGGTTYKYSAQFANQATSTGYDATIVLDQYGYVIDVDTSASSSNYAVVLNYKKDAGTYGSDTIARLLFTDGTIKDVTLTGTVVGLTSGASVGTIVSYSIKSTGKYTLTYNTAISKIKTDVAASSTVVTNNTTSLTYDNTVTVNASTIFLVATKSGDDTIYTAYTGIKNVPTITATATTTASYVLKTTSKGAAVTPSTASVVFVDATKATTSTSSKDVVLVYATEAPSVTSSSAKGDYYTYDAIVNGVATKLDVAPKSDGSAPYSTSTMATGISYDSNKVATLSGEYGTGSVGDHTSSGNGIIVAQTAAKADSEVITLGGKAYTYTSDCNAFVVDGDGDITTASVKGLGAYAVSDGAFIFAKMTDSDLTTIVVVQKATSASPVTPTTGSFTAALAKNGLNIELDVATKTAVTADTTVTYTVYGTNTTSGYTYTVGTGSATILNGATAPASAPIVVTNSNNNMVYYAVVTISGESVTTTSIVG